MRWFPILLLAACGTPATNTGASVEEDGSFSLLYRYARDDVYHAAVAAAKECGYTIEVADPMSARVSGRSEIKRRGLGAQVQYYVLRADVEAPQPGAQGVRVRVTITFTHHLSGQTRTSMNDKIVGSREKYDDYFTAISKQLGG
ncbi:MAG: hypothetical protein ACYTHK_10295 [Planctomycetota bacterium]|jgi:hypothetical protein